MYAQDTYTHTHTHTLLFTITLCPLSFAVVPDWGSRFVEAFWWTVSRVELRAVKFTGPGLLKRDADKSWNSHCYGVIGLDVPDRLYITHPSSSSRPSLLQLTTFCETWCSIERVVYTGICCSVALRLLSCSTCVCMYACMYVGYHKVSCTFASLGWFSVLVNYLTWRRNPPFDRITLLHIINMIIRGLQQFVMD